MEIENQSLPEIENADKNESTKMDNVNVLKLMAEYDFNKTIEVTIILEDSDDGTNNNNYTEIHKKKTPFKEINKNVSGKKNNTNIEKIRKNIPQVKDQIITNKSVYNIHSRVVRNKFREDTESDKQTVQTLVEDLLDKLSENLLMIMQSYYYYDFKKKSNLATEEANLKMKQAYRFIRSHFFEISYTTVESVILPLEQNAPLINQFLENTMMIADLKFSKWKIQKHHIQQLLNELIVWSKHKYSQMKTIKQTPNDNINLRQHLIRPPPPYPLTNVNNAPNSKNVPPQKSNTQNDMLCIFRSGTPGSQISINVNPETLLCAKKHNTYSDEFIGNRHTVSSSLPASNRSVAPMPNDNSNNYYHQPPPHLNQNPAHPIQYPIQNRYNIGQQHQHRQNTGYPIQQNHQIQVPCPNMNRIPLSQSDSMNPLRYDCTNVNNRTHETELEPRISSRPVITNVTTIYPEAYMGGRCCMCGKMCEQRYYAQSNYPVRPTYCSSLCQELDDQVWQHTMCST